MMTFGSRRPSSKISISGGPATRSPASARTEVLAGYDSRFIYFAFHAYDDPAKVRATVAKRDNIFDDDVVGLLLDTFNDKRRAYELFFNPFGIQQDGFLTEGGNDDFSVDIVMESKGTVTADGFTVEVAIPFKSLRYEAGQGKLWGFHALRFVKHANGETDSWMPISKDNSALAGSGGPHHRPRRHLDRTHAGTNSERDLVRNRQA